MPRECQILNLVTPYVQQWNFGVQQELKGGFIVEGRYVGNHLVDGLHSIDYNQINIQADGFLADFVRARNNGFLSANAGLGFDPSYTGPGTQPLTVFPQLPYGGLFTNPTIDHYIQTGEAGELAAIYIQNGLNGNVPFFPNPYTNGANVVTNYASSSYNGLQLDVRKRTSTGAQFQFNSTLSKVLGNTAAIENSDRFEPFLDLNNGHIERGPLPFDIRNVFHGNFYYPIPMGTGHRFAYAPLNRAMNGWGVSSIITYQSGGDFSVLSALATLNRAGINRSGLNTVNTLLNKNQLNSVAGFFMTGNGPISSIPPISMHRGSASRPLARRPSPAKYSLTRILAPWEPCSASCLTDLGISTGISAFKRLPKSPSGRALNSAPTSSTSPITQPSLPATNTTNTRLRA